MNKKLINVLSTSFLVMGLAAGCGVATDEAGNDRTGNNLRPVGYDNNTNYSPLNVNDPGGAIIDQDPLLNPDEGEDGDAIPGEGGAGGAGEDGAGGAGEGGAGGAGEDGAGGAGEDGAGGAGEDEEGIDDNTPGVDDATPNGDDVDPGNVDETPGEDDEEPGNDETTPGEDNEEPGNDETPGGDDEEEDERTDTQTPVESGNTAKFADVPENSDFYNDIHAARDLGLMNGRGNNQFGLGKNITREEVASLLMKAVRNGYFVVDANNGANGNAGTNE